MIIQNIEKEEELENVMNAETAIIGEKKVTEMVLVCQKVILLKNKKIIEYAHIP